MIPLKEAEESIKKEIFWLIPNDYSTTMSAINQGKTIPSLVPGAEIAENFRELAAVFLEKGETKKEKSGFWSEILGLKQAKGKGQS